MTFNFYKNYIYLFHKCLGSDLSCTGFQGQSVKEGCSLCYLTLNALLLEPEWPINVKKPHVFAVFTFVFFLFCIGLV